MEEQNTPLFFPAFDSGSAFEDLRAGHSAIRTTQYAGMIKWYCEVLDFRLIREWTSGTMKLAFLALPGDNSFMIEVLGLIRTRKNREHA